MNWKLAVTWLVAVSATTFVIWQIVNVADSRVSAQPVEASALEPSTSTTTTTLTSASSTPPPPGTSVPSSPPSTTPSTSPSQPDSTTTTAAAAAWTVRTINTSGGTVVIRYRPGEVELQAATPAAGFDVEIDDPGPPEVRVEFESGEDEVKVEADWSDGELQVEVSEE